MALTRLFILDLVILIFAGLSGLLSLISFCVTIHWTIYAESNCEGCIAETQTICLTRKFPFAHNFSQIDITLQMSTMKWDILNHLFLFYHFSLDKFSFVFFFKLCISMSKRKRSNQTFMRERSLDGLAFFYDFIQSTALMHERQLNCSVV